MPEHSWKDIKKNLDKQEAAIATRDLILRDICEVLPTDQLESTICIEYETLYAIVDKHLTGTEK